MTLLSLLAALAASPGAYATGQSGQAGSDASTSDVSAQPAEGALMAATADAAATAQEDQLYLDALRLLSQGRPEEATIILTRLLEKNSHHAGAWLDLAISQCEMGNAAEAERLFRETENRFSPPPGIRELIASYRKHGCEARNAPRRIMSFKVGRGHDNNVNQGSSSRYFSIGSGAFVEEIELGQDSLPQSDWYSAMSADVSQPVGSNGTLLIGQVRAQRNDTVRRQDSASALLGLEQPWRTGSWQGRATAMYGLVRLGGELYQRQAQLLVRTTPPLALPKQLDWSLAAGLSRVEYPTRQYYNASTLDLGTSVSYRAKAADMLLSAGALFDDGQDSRPGGNRRGWYSALTLYAPLPGKLSGEFSLVHQDWRSERAYTAGLIDTARHQQTSQMRASLQLPVAGYGALQLEYRRIWNQENISLFQYNSRMLQLSWRVDNW